MITVYTRDNCQPCLATKRKLTQEGIEYREVNVDHTPGAGELLRGEGWRELPVVITEWADKQWSGYRPDKIKELAR